MHEPKLKKIEELTIIVCNKMSILLSPLVAQTMRKAFIKLNLYTKEGTPSSIYL
jgi:hypothetical protein